MHSIGKETRLNNVIKFYTRCNYMNVRPWTKMLSQVQASKDQCIYATLQRLF